MKNKVSLIISIDTECDKGPGWLIPKPMSFRNILEGVPGILTPLFKEFNIKPTYLLSPEIIKSEQCVTVLKELDHAELGTHLHGEFIEPDALPDANRTKTAQLQYSPEIEKMKLINLTNLFIEKFGYRPTSFRAGRWGMSKNTLGYLEELNYTVDSSICSFRTHYFDNKSVNFWGAPLQPYYPSLSDFRKKGRMKIIEVPTTIGNPHLMKWPRFVLRKLNDKSSIHKKILGKLGRSPKITWLRPWKSNADDMIMISNAYIKHYSNLRKPVVLNMMFHSNEIMQGSSPYAQSKEDIRSYINSMELTFGYLIKNYNLNSVGLSEVNN